MKLLVERGGNLSASQVTKHLSRATLFLSKLESEEGGKFNLRDEEGTVVTSVRGDNTDKTIEDLKAFTRSGDRSKFRGSYYIDVKEFEDPVSISALEKTAEFGGGGGVAGGSTQTKYAEAGQCICCSLAQKGLLTDSLTADTEALENLDVSFGKGESVDSINTGMLQLGDDWKKALVAIAKALVEKLGTTGVWHWQDSFVKSIEQLYSKTSDKLAGKFDRYNPADIWYTDKYYSSIEDLGINEVGKLEDLTEKLVSLYDDKKVVGISLKKTSDPILEPYDGSKREQKIVISQVNVKKRQKGTTTLTIEFDVNGESCILQIRKNNTNSIRGSFKAKKGKDHFDGSIGGDIILHCLSKVFSKEEVEQCLPSYYLDQLKKQQEEYIYNHPGDFEDKDLQEAEDSLEGQYPIEDVEMPEVFEGKLDVESFTIAKSLDKIGELLSNSSQVDEVLGRMFRYAYSLHTRSCTFLKVH